jgi:hypothetical protein
MPKAAKKTNVVTLSPMEGVHLFAKGVISSNFCEREHIVKFLGGANKIVRNNTKLLM